MNTSACLPNPGDSRRHSRKDSRDKLETYAKYFLNDAEPDYKDFANNKNTVDS